MRRIFLSPGFWAGFGIALILGAADLDAVENIEWWLGLFGGVAVFWALVAAIEDALA